MNSFTPGELEIMQVLWEFGSLKPAEIQANFPRTIRNAALRSALLVLMEKGHIERKKVGKAYYYSAITPSRGYPVTNGTAYGGCFLRGIQSGPDRSTDRNRRVIQRRHRRTAANRTGEDVRIISVKIMQEDSSCFTP